MTIIAEQVKSSLLGRFLILVSVTLAASACGSGGGSDRPTPSVPVSVSESDRLVLEVQPIQVCDDGGIVCAQVEFFETIADKIWDQADIEITFLPLNQLNESDYLTTDDDEFADLSFSGDPGSFGRHPDSTRTTGPINLWFVDEIEADNGLRQYGNAWIGFNGVLISDDILDFNNGVGRLDVISHELGHNLGLRHSTFGAGPADNLMSSGRVRTVPESIDDIFPDGDGVSQLTPEQIAQARTSGFLTEVAPDSLPVDDSLPVIEADAVPLTLVNPPNAPIASFTDSPIAMPQLLTSVSPIQSVPESSPSPITWLLLLPLAQRAYSRIYR